MVHVPLNGIIWYICIINYICDTLNKIFEAFALNPHQKTGNF